jgi:hypothetical protein
MTAKRREKRISAEERTIAILYCAIQKEGWQEGPTESEAIAAANDWFYNKYGYEERGAASDEIPAMLRTAPPRRQRGQNK